MAQRNPMNDRYQGEGPAGKSRKSAASAKPKAEAAASVFIEKKPETPRERKAAQKRRAAEKQRKEQERLRRTKEKERAARIAAGLEVEPEKKKSFLESLISPRSQPASSVSDTKAGAPSQKATGPQATAQKPAASQATAQKPATSQTTGQKTASARATAPKATSASATTSITTSSAQDAEPQKTGFFGRMQNPNQPQTPEFKKLRRIYWILMGIALVAVILSLVTQMTGLFTQPAWMICLGAAYLCAIGGIVLDIAKIRPMQKAYTQQFASGGKKTPKQIKHETEAAAYAREIERAREAERAAKKGTNRAGMLKSKNRMSQGLEQGSANDKTKAGEKPID